jgi:hypothetical protein
MNIDLEDREIPIDYIDFQPLVPRRVIYKYFSSQPYIKLSLRVPSIPVLFLFHLRRLKIETQNFTSLWQHSRYHSNLRHQIWQRNLSYLRLHLKKFFNTLFYSIILDISPCIHKLR